MQCKLLLAICSGAKYTRCVYVESGTDIFGNLRGSLHIVSDLPRVEDATKTEGNTYCRGQAQDPFGLDLFCKSRDLDNVSSVYSRNHYSEWNFTLEIVRPESMAPFGNTMRFINGN